MFFCNQDLTLAQRDKLTASVSGPLTLYHLERITAVLDQPGSVRRQYKLEDDSSYRLEALQTGGGTYAYVMFYHFDLELNIAQNVLVSSQENGARIDVRWAELGGLRVEGDPAFFLTACRWTTE